jgi:hypothetical protein
MYYTLYTQISRRAHTSPLATLMHFVVHAHTHTHAHDILTQAKKATHLVTLERRTLDDTELTMNNMLALALDSKSSKSVQLVLDITAAKQVC